LSFADDEVLSPESTEFLHGLYTGSDRVHRHLSPADVGMDRIGHHGFFRKQHARLWDELVIPAIAVTER
jgi:predicted alpha/beta hydrolase